MPISGDEFKSALRLFPSGVTVVTMRAGDHLHGLTVSAFASVSPDPPLISIIIDHRHRAHALLEASDAVFAVNFLGEEQAALSERFAFSKEDDRFAGARWRTAATGAPILDGALAWLDCRVHSRLPAGTHTIYVGEVLASGTDPSRHPLVYWNRAYRKLAADE